MIMPKTVEIVDEFIALKKRNVRYQFVARGNLMKMLQAFLECSLLNDAKVTIIPKWGSMAAEKGNESLCGNTDGYDPMEYRKADEVLYKELTTGRIYTGRADIKESLTPNNNKGTNAPSVGFTIANPTLESLGCGSFDETEIVFSVFAESQETIDYKELLEPLVKQLINNGAKAPIGQPDQKYPESERNGLIALLCPDMS